MKSLQERWGLQRKVYKVYKESTLKFLLKIKEVAKMTKKVKSILLGVIFGAMLLVISSGSVAMAQYEWDANTVILDHFDGTTVGTAFGPITYEDSLPVLGQAINLVPGGYVKYALPYWYSGGGVQGTVEMWINPRQYGLNEGWPPILTLQWLDVTSIPSSGYVGGFVLRSDGKLGWWVWNGQGDGGIAGETTIPLNEWTHVAVSWAPDGTKLYVNGVVDASTSANAWPSLSSPTYAYLNWWEQWDLGYVDELRISNVARSEEEIRDYVAPFLITTVTIDIKPGSFLNSINLRSKGNVSVAILSDSTFDATTVDRDTVVFAGAFPLPIGQTPEDVNGDGLLDVVLHFKTQDLNLQPGDTEACLSGKTLDGQDIEGCDSVCIVK